MSNKDATPITSPIFGTFLGWVVGDQRKVFANQVVAELEDEHGNAIQIVAPGRGIVPLYSRLKQEGDEVQAGEIVGYMGAWV